MEKKSCRINITELDDGYRIEITGEGVKENCSCIPIVKSCCTGEKQEEKKSC